MSYTYTFKDNEIYGAEDINRITKRLVTSGIADTFTDGVPFNLSKFNEAGALIYTSGVVPETCNTLKVVRESKTEVRIHPGAAFFNDGTVIEIDEGGHTLSVTPGVYTYIYLKNDLTYTNTCYPESAETAPTGDFVPLAEINETGTIKDCRTYAMGKLPGYASSDGYFMQIDDTVKIPIGTDGIFLEEHEVTYDIGNNHYQYLLSVQGGQANDYRLVSLYRFSDGTYNSFGVYSASKNETSTEELFLYRDYYRYAKASVAVKDAKLTLSIKYGASTDFYGHEFPIKLYLF